MNCPVCKAVSLEEKINENGLRVFFCKDCNGSWIRFENYYAWKTKDEKNNLFNSVSSTLDGGNSTGLDGNLLEHDSEKAMLCPDCGRILIKYRVSTDILFNVDNCGSCNGVWLDKHEWDTLAKNHLHDKLNDFFTTPWQKRLRMEMRKISFEEKYKNKFGIENYNKLKEIRNWIHNSDLKGEMIAYLIDDDPYGI